MKLLVSGARMMAEIPELNRIPAGVDVHFAPDETALHTALPGTEILLGWDFRGRELQRQWSRADRLRWIHWCGAGVDAVLFPALVDSEVQVTNARGIFDRAIAETVLGYLLTETKGFRESWERQKRHEWHPRRSERLQNQRALVVGVGNIGREIGRVLQLVGMQVQGIGRTTREKDPVFGRIHPLQALKSLARNVDWVIGILPSTAETRGLFDHGVFQAMRPEARFVNVGRGDAQDEAALEKALRSGTIAGAMLDVFGTEPLPADSTLWDTPNLFVTPHISGDYQNFPSDIADQFLDNLARYCNGRQLLNPIDKALGYAKYR